MKITAKFLTDRRACNEQVKLFRKTFPKGAIINPENLQRANRAGLSLYWLIRRLRGDGADNLPYQAVEKSPENKLYNKLDTALSKELDRAWTVCERKRMAAWRQMTRNINKAQRDNDVSVNEAKRLEKIECQKYVAFRKELRNAERVAERAIRRKYAAQMRKARIARSRRETEILIPHVMEAVTIYRASQRKTVE